MGIELAPSMMCADLLKLREQMDVINRRGHICHLDIMDGHFAPNLAISPYMARTLRSVAQRPMEAHLMTTDPGRWIEVYGKIGMDEISVHAETITGSAFRLFDAIEAYGAKPGLALCPATTVDSVIHLLTRVSFINIMTVDIGYAGSPFIPEMLEKIRRAAELRKQRGLNFKIQVDGGCRRDTYKALRDAGADRFVMGTALFDGGDASLNGGYDRVTRDIEETTGEKVA